jgi:hypothetical protein
MKLHPIDEPASRPVKAVAGAKKNDGGVPLPAAVGVNLGSDDESDMAGD